MGLIRKVHQSTWVCLLILPPKWWREQTEAAEDMSTQFFSSSERFVLQNTIFPGLPVKLPLAALSKDIR